jgi:hypothetical protein
MIKIKYEEEPYEQTKYDNVCAVLISTFGIFGTLLALFTGKQVKVTVRDTEDVVFVKECAKAGMTYREVKDACRSYYRGRKEAEKR